VNRQRVPPRYLSKSTTMSHLHDHGDSLASVSLLELEDTVLVDSVSNILNMKTPETSRSKRSVRRLLSGWWKKKRSYYVDIHQDLQQDATMFPEEESMGSLYYEDDDIFDAASFQTTPSPSFDVGILKPTRSLDRPVTPLSSRRTTPLRQRPSSTPPLIHSTPPIPEMQEMTLPYETPPRPCSTPPTMELSTSEDTEDEEEVVSNTPLGCMPRVYEQPTTPHFSKMQVATPVKRVKRPHHTDGTEEKEVVQTPSPNVQSPPSIVKEANIMRNGMCSPPPIQEEDSLLTLPFVHTSFSTGSLLSMDSLVDSEYWDDEEETLPSRHTFNRDFFAEHVTFLRVQTKPRRVEVVWAEDDMGAC